MRLERLEISGFKSFSDRAELAFDRGVTAIVGPNGCGKSNVADAITWVLGEQSAKSLRGDKMEDVIFNGSDARKAGATAEVRLRLSGLVRQAPPTIDRLPTPGYTNGNGHHAHESSGANGNGNGNGHGNGNGYGAISGVVPAPSALTDDFASFVADFTRDVEVTRRLYRSGESEYLIDGETCRLRDVHELLMDTGLGAKAYAIIEQGKIGMILSSRPTDRRQLIEEAAGVTKYKSRRRSAELKLEAAQQNLTRVDDIVFEVEKQRGTLKRQAAKARRYRKLREDLRRWEKVLFARRYRELAHGIEQARSELTRARERETVALAHLAEVEATLGRLRIEHTEAEAAANAVREDAHARELDINRRQQQLTFDRQQADALAARVADLDAEILELGARREPARIALESRRAAIGDAERSRDEAAGVLAAATAAQQAALQRLEQLESEVDGSREQLFGVINALTAIRHATAHTESQQLKVAERLGKLDVETTDVTREQDAIAAAERAAADAHARAQQAIEAVTLERTARESELATSRRQLDICTHAVRMGEQDLAALEARLSSLEELQASRAGFDDGARMVLIQANGRVGQRGAVADFLEVDGRYERAVEACLGELLQHVVVERHEHAEAGLTLVREQGAGRCGFVVIGNDADRVAQPIGDVPGAIPVSRLLRVAGPYAETIRRVLPEAYVTETFEQGAEVARMTAAPVATLLGDVFRGPHLVAGGTKVEARGILQTKREIKELRERLTSERFALERHVAQAAALDVAVAQIVSAIAALQDEQHRLEKVSVGLDAQIQKVADDRARLARKAETVAFERRQADEERAMLMDRLSETEAQSLRLLDEQRVSDGRLGEAQSRLTAARASIDDLSRRSAEAGASHAALVERASALHAEVARLEEGSRELESRIAGRGLELEQLRGRREQLLASIADGERGVDDGVRELETVRQQLLTADEKAASLRGNVDGQDTVIRDARAALEGVRAEAGALEVARATAESDLGHLSQSCMDAVQCPLEEVLAEVEALEQSGEAVPDRAAIAATEEIDGEIDEQDADAVTESAGLHAASDAVLESSEPLPSMTAEGAITALKGKIDRLGPVNMMAIEQYDELESRHAFLTTQRRDLVESIAQTTEAITRIDETTKVRFREAFTAIQQNFQITFSTLFGGGHAGLTLLDENDPLESGIDIVASPPGKRLQSVQLLSGGEKALTAIALMFAIFQYKPSPFCLLDEIDAPLDDANVSRFVEMLRGMLDRTQFILITHNRRTMEIANRLYGVTMEEPGVSKLISVQLH